MPMPLELMTLSLWPTHPRSAALVAPGDRDGARLCLSESVGHDVAQSRLRGIASDAGCGNDLSRLDQHQLVELLTPWVADGWLRDPSADGPLLNYTLVPVAAPAAAAAAAPPPAASPRPTAAAAPPEPAETTFGANLDIAAIVAVLQAAAQAGVPFCEECAKAAASPSAEAQAA